MLIEGFDSKLTDDITLAEFVVESVVELVIDFANATEVGCIIRDDGK